MNLFFYTLIYCITFSLAQNYARIGRYVDDADQDGYFLDDAEQDVDISEDVEQVEDIIDHVLGDWDPLEVINTNMLQSYNLDQPNNLPKIVSVEEDLDGMVSKEDEMAQILPDQEITEAAKRLMQLKNHLKDIELKESIHLLPERPLKKNRLIS